MFGVPGFEHEQTNACIRENSYLFSEQPRKSSFKDRMASSAYHQARKEALRLGKSPNAQKTMGRSASQKVRADIEAGILKEK